MMSTDFPHQVCNAQVILNRFSAGLNAGDWSETGTGKTRTALRVIRVRPAPTLVVGPKIARRAWELAGIDTGTEFDYINWEALRYGTSPYGWWERRPRGGVVFIRCDARTEQNLEGIWFYRFTFHSGVRRVIWDEVHRAKGNKSQNANMVRGACRQGLQQLGVSATPASDPTEMRALGTMLGWFTWDDWYKWTLRNGCWKPPFGGLKFTDCKATADMHLGRIRPAMIEAGPKTRLRDVHPNNALVVDPMLVTLDDGAVAEMIGILERLRDIEEALYHKQLAATSALTERIFLRQRLELLRLPAVVEFAKDQLEAGKTVLMFVNFRETLTALAILFPAAGQIHGDVPEAVRQRVMADVRDGTMRTVLLQNQAGGETISLQDISGIRPVVSILGVPESAQQFIQIAGRTDRLLGASVPLLVPMFVAGTVEEKIWRRISMKADRIRDLTDSDLRP